MALGASLALSNAAIIGMNVPANPLTVERIANLPKKAQAPWRQYLERSERQSQADRAFLLNELQQHDLKAPIIPPEGRAIRSMPLHEAADWYRGAEAQRIADIIVSFQTPSGGWSKNLSMSQHPRASGESFAPGNLTHFPSPADYDAPHDLSRNYVGTFDNDATITQLRFLAKVIAALPNDSAAPYRASFLRGLDYVFASQYPNGGWPQVWPLQGGYHDAITFNDDAMVNILNLLRDIVQARAEFAFVPAPTRARASASMKSGIQCVLASQIIGQGHRTVWCQQHDALTLEPASARNYEMPAQVSAESARLLVFLMGLPHPDKQIRAAIHAAAAWLEKVKIEGVEFRWDGMQDRRLVSAPGSGPLWARYYQIGTDRPIFGDRDKTIHDDVSEISQERRNGYSWYGGYPEEALRLYASWRQAQPEKASKAPRAFLSSPKGVN